jgi:hypothetical protein
VITLGQQCLKFIFSGEHESSTHKINLSDGYQLVCLTFFHLGRRKYFLYLHCVHAINNDQGAVEPNFGRYLPSARPVAAHRGCSLSLSLARSLREKGSPLKIWIFDTSPTWRNALFPAAKSKTTIEMMTDDFLCLIRAHADRVFLSATAEIAQMEIMLFWLFSLASARQHRSSCSLFDCAPSRRRARGRFFLPRGGVIIILKARDRRNPRWYYCNYRAYYDVIYGARGTERALISPFCFCFARARSLP